MIRSRKNKGSVLLMVIGVLTMIAILGSAFIIVSHADAQQSAALADRAQAEPIAQGVVTRLASAMVNDLWLDSNCTWPPIDGNGLPRKGFNDANRRYADANLPIRAGAGTDPNLRRVLHDPNYSPFRTLSSDTTGWYRAIDSDSNLVDPWMTAFPYSKTDELVDVNGDGVDDTYLCDTGIRNSKGDTFYVASVTTDLASKVNVNVASSMDMSMPTINNPRSPSFVRLDGMLNTNPVYSLLQYNSIHNARASKLDEANYAIYCARQLLQPGRAITATGVYASSNTTLTVKADITNFGLAVNQYIWSSGEANSYRIVSVTPPSTIVVSGDCSAQTVFVLSSKTEFRPFQLTDELLLRWRKPGSLYEQGRLHKAFSPGPTIVPESAVNPSVLANLTTFSASSNWLRVPYMMNLAANDPTAAWKKLLDANAVFTTKLTPVLGSPQGEHDLYRTVFMMLRAANLTPNTTRDSNYLRLMAAAYVANAKAATGTGNWPYAFQPRITLGEYGRDPANYDANTLYPRGFIAYGAQRDLVISKIFAMDANRGVPEPNADPATAVARWGCAIELFNPTSTTIDANGYALYKFHNGSWTPGPILFSTLADASRLKIPPGGRYVVFAAKLNSGGMWIDGNSTDVGMGLLGEANNAAAVRHRISGGTTPPSLGFQTNSGGNAGWTFRLARIADPNVAIDTFSNTDAAYSRPSYNTLDANRNVILSSRDDVVARGHYALPLYLRSTTSTCGQLLGMPSPSTPAFDTWAGVHLPEKPAARVPLFDFGDLMRIPFASRLYIFPNPAANSYVSFGNFFDANRVPILDPNRSNLAGLDFLPSDALAGGYVPGVYPDIPPACLWSDFFNMVPPDASRNTQGATATRTYGKININTASRAVLSQLPLTQAVSIEGITFMTDTTEAVNRILAYRNGTRTNPNPSFPSVANLRVSSPAPCFLTESEIAIPLAMYCRSLMPASVGGIAIEKHPRYAEARDYLYSVISNMITVRSDTYAVNIRVQLGRGGSYKAVWNYVAVIDRGNCLTISDSPSVLLFSQVR